MRRGFGYNGFGYGKRARSSTAIVSIPLSLDFQSGAYQVGATSYGTLASVPGYSYARTGAKWELTPGGVLTAFAANAPGTVSGTGMWLRASITNNFLRSSELSSASWNKSASVTVTEDATVAPDGTTTMDRIVSGGSAAESWQMFTNSVTPYTVCGFFKADGSAGRYPYLFLGGSGNALAFFDLTNGVPATLSGSASNKSSGIISCGGGIYFCWLTANATASSTAYGSGWSSVDGTATAATGVGGYRWGMQLLLGSNPGPIMNSSAATVTNGADTLSVTVANGTYTEVTTFDDGSTQTRTPTVSGNTYTVPVYPTTLNRPLVRKVTLT